MDHKSLIQEVLNNPKSPKDFACKNEIERLRGTGTGMKTKSKVKTKSKDKKFSQDIKEVEIKDE